MLEPSALDDAFPGLYAGWTVADKRPIYEWAADRLTLPGSYNPPGRFDVSYRRPLIAIFDAIQNPLVRRVRFRKPPRFGGSMIADIAIPYLICNDPGTIMWNWQKQEAAADHMKEKAWPLWLSCAPFRAMLPPGKYDRTTTKIFLGDFFMVCQGASPNNLQGKGIRYLFNDEIWLPVWQDLYRQAVSRTRDFAETECEKVVDVSQAGNENDIEDTNWREGNQGVWSYLAPDGKHYPLLMGGQREDGSRWGLTWNDDAKRPDGAFNKARAIETARYECRYTRHVWTDSRKARAEWNRDGAYVDQNPDAPASIRSYSVSALLNNSFEDLVSRKIAALELAEYGDISGLRDVKQQDECVPWKETLVSVTLSSLSAGYKYADHKDGQLWEGEVDRSMMIDRQRGFKGDVPHWWVEARAWKANGDSRQLYFGRVETIEQVREIQLTLKIKDRKVFEDAGFDAPAVYMDCVRYGWLAMFGSTRTSWPHEVPHGNTTRKVHLPYSGVQRTRAQNGGTALYLHFAADYCKDILARLVGGHGPAWQYPDDVSPQYLEHLKGETKQEVRPGKYEWRKITSHTDNHGWDTSTMHVCFALFTRRLGMPEIKDPDTKTPPG